MWKVTPRYDSRTLLKRRRTARGKKGEELGAVRVIVINNNFPYYLYGNSFASANSQHCAKWKRKIKVVNTFKVRKRVRIKKTGS